jgi:hypothetical protein
VERLLAGIGAFQYLAILHEDRVTGMRDGERDFGQQIEVRCWDSVDARTATPTRLSFEIIEKLALEIIREVPGIVSVTYNVAPPSNERRREMRLGLFVLSLVLVLGPSVYRLRGQGISQDTLPENHLVFTLRSVEDRFKGANEHLRGFTVSMDISQEQLEGGLLSIENVTRAVRNLKVTGTLTYPDGASTEIEYEVVRHRDAEGIYMKTTLGFFLWESAVVRDDELMFVIDFWYTPPARPTDLAALELAERLLADSVNWHQQDDRRCGDDIERNKWSLFCALKHASVEKMGEYNHHNSAMNAVRFIIDDVVRDHGFAHPLMDYNNAQSTRHADVLRVLAIAKERVKQELEDRSLSFRQFTATMFGSSLMRRATADTVAE